MQKEWRDQVKMGGITFKNRVVMAALTRQRCDIEQCIPTQLVVEYYSQRASAGFILTQATSWSPLGKGFFGAACLYNQQQMQGWRKVVDAVHAKGGKIFLQIFHCGRVSHPLKLNGQQPVGPSPIAVREAMRDLQGKQFSVPKQMTLQDIEIAKRQFQQSVIYAKQANFDGIQLHGAHGYLIDSFLRTSSNIRTDIYGGSVENRCRLALELTDIAIKHFEPYRIGIKISPVSKLKDMYDENPIQTYSYLVKELDKKKIGFIQARESTQFYPFPNLYPKTQKQQIPDVCEVFRPLFSGVLIGNDSFDATSGLAKIRAGLCDMISYGRYAVSNPDLAQRLINAWQLAKWQPKTFYGTKWGASGYTDYPFYQQK